MTGTTNQSVIRQKKRRPVRAVLISAAVLLVLLLAACQTVTAILYSQNFDVRFDGSGTFAISDFSNLEYQTVSFPSDKGQMLHGDFIWDMDLREHKAVIVVNHGFGGGGYHWYLDQIDLLARNGYLIFAFDKTGNDGSEGESVNGLAQGVIDLQAALGVVRTEERSRDLPIFLYGHSWGGFSSCAVLEYEDDIEAVVSFSGFNQSKDMLIDQGVSMYGGMVRLMSPFLTVCDLYRFGSHAFDSSEKGLAATRAEVLLFHSADDPVINIRDSFDLYQEKLGGRTNLHFVRLDGKGHNVFNEAESTALDMDVMAQVIEFYDGVLKRLEQ